jgi:hypothetical protein
MKLLIILTLVILSACGGGDPDEMRIDPPKCERTVCA